MRCKRVPLFAATLAFAVAVNADAPFATAAFEKIIDGTDKRTPITAARLNEHVCLTIRDVSTNDGDHSLKLVIYDGGGREVYQSVGTVTAKDGKWRYTVCYGFHVKRDSPGTWWYVTELDDQPLISKELVVSPIQSPGVG